MRSWRPGDLPRTGTNSRVYFNGLTTASLGCKKLVKLIEQVIIDLLADYSIHAERRDNAPGVYIDGAKIAALGLRVRRGCSYHGLSLNVDMDLTPFTYINPCGFEGLASVQMKDLNPSTDVQDVKKQLIEHLNRQLFSVNHTQ